jgi:hypothetical protein
LLADLSACLGAEAKGKVTQLGGEALGAPREGPNGHAKPLGEDFSCTAWIGTKEAADM